MYVLTTLILPCLAFSMKVRVLGCATSTGVPIVGCPCDVCTSDNIKNRRTRSSVLVDVAGKKILVDTSTDLRAQALREGITRVDLVLYTHSHADHTHGIDDLKAFNFMNSMDIDCYANQFTLGDIKRNFAYIFDSFPAAGGKPRLNFKEGKRGNQVRGNHYRADRHLSPQLADTRLQDRIFRLPYGLQRHT